ncbi:glucocorticoid-induced transcript 1 protein-like [Saccopteryx leptura]|uniref:glucocorticoid-induced transcript 1 protein-like n=1 Tax=Saccopteryx leptura TaxID=249018 RepID=UPI00339BFDD1
MSFKMCITNYTFIKEKEFTLVEASLRASIPGAPSIRASRAPAGQCRPGRSPAAPGERRRPARGVEPAPASPAGWSREPEISAGTASLSSPKRPGRATRESRTTPTLPVGAAGTAEAFRGAGPAWRERRRRRRRECGSRESPARQTKLTTWLPPLEQVTSKLSRSRRRATAKHLGGRCPSTSSFPPQSRARSRSPPASSTGRPREAGPGKLSTSAARN